MALTRRFLEGMGIDDKQIESIIEAHGETVTALKSQRDKAQEEAKRVPDLERQLEDAKAASAGTDDWKRKYESEHKALEDFKKKVDSERAEEAKAKAYRSMLREAGIDPRRIDSIMRVTDLSKVTVKDGELEKADELKDSAKKEWSDFVLKTETRGSNPATPPKADKGVAGADPEIAKHLQQRHERLYGKPATERE